MNSYRLIFAALLIATVAASAASEKKRKPANAPDIKCLNSVHQAFHDKWDPIRDQIRSEDGLTAKKRSKLHSQSRQLLLAKSEAIKTCNNNSKNVSITKVLQPFK